MSPHFSLFSLKYSTKKKCKNGPRLTWKVNKIIVCNTSFITYSFIKDQISLATGPGILADFWVPHKIVRCNVKNLLVFGFPETSFRQLLFSLFQKGDPFKGGPFGKIWKPQKSAKMTSSWCQDDLVLLGFSQLNKKKGGNVWDIKDL